MRTASIFLLGLAAIVTAQSNFTTCCSVAPATVETNTRLAWCRAQQNTCPEICPNGQTSKNDCDPDKLTFTCECLSGNTPNISSFMQTLPSLECDEWKGQCTKAHPNDLNGQTFCQSFECGKQNSSAMASTNTGSGSNGGGSSSSSRSSASGTPSGNAPSESQGAAATLRVGKDFGTSLVLLGLTAVFGFAL